jgi:uncharacterized damage-inducible protein DinB
MPGLSSDPIDILIASDAWGTRAVLTICATLTHEQFHKMFPIGLGSLHDTLTHMVSVMRRWTDRLAGRTPRPMLHLVAKYPHLEGEARDRAAQELLVLLDEAERDLVSVMRTIRSENRLASTISLDWPGDDGTTKTYIFSRGCVVVHLTTHGYHHRAQCLNMLRQLGAPVPGVTDGYPEPSAVDWQAETESPAVVKVK